MKRCPAWMVAISVSKTSGETQDPLGVWPGPSIVKYFLEANNVRSVVQVVWIACLANRPRSEHPMPG